MAYGVKRENPDLLPHADTYLTWKKTWADAGKMPLVSQEEQGPRYSIKVHFRNDADRQAFAKLIGQEILPRTRSVWHPEATIEHLGEEPRTAKQVNPRYPVYVISKGRWESRLTVKTLEAINVPYRVVVEPQEFDRYAAVIAPEKILTLPFSNLGQGSIPARNWVWEHAVASGAARHWILDDNIRGFYRMYQNRKVAVATGHLFRAAEDFTDRWSNVGLSGFQYFMFYPRKRLRPNYTLNTRIYSCILVRNDLTIDGEPVRWRGRYNEDTDLSLRVLKTLRYCTILFNVFLANKMPTMKMRGGNTDELYQGDGRLLMAESLREQHDDMAIVTTKWGRAQHQVHFKHFQALQQLELSPTVVVPEGADPFDMILSDEETESKSV